MELDVLSDDVLIVFIVIDFWGSFVCQADCEIVILLCPFIFFLSFSMMEIKSWSVKPKDVSVFVGHGWARMSPEKAMPQKSCHFCHLIAFAYVIRIGLHHHAGDNNAHSYCHFAPNCHFESLSCHCLVMSLGLSFDLSFELSFNLCFGRFVSFDLIHVTHLLIGRITACRRKRI